MEKVVRITRKVVIIALLMFTIELIFGYTGTMLMIHGIAIRHILFIVSFLSSYLFCLLYIIKNKIKVFSMNRNISIWGSFRLLDWLLLALVFSTFISFLVIPQITGFGFTLAKREIMDTGCMLLLYFPVRFMILWNQINFKKYLNFVYVLLALLSILHIVLFVGQTINNTFINSYFDLLKAIVAGHSITPGIILGHGGYPRVMYGTSVYILVGIYLVLNRLPKWKYYDYVVFAIHIVSLLSTMTKSIWFGAVIGGFIYLTLYVTLQVKNKNHRAILQVIGISVCSIILVALLNATLFQGLIGARISNSFATSGSNQYMNSSEFLQSSSNSSDSENSSEDTQEENLKQKYLFLDSEGAAISNDIKIEQTKRLIEQWKNRPFFGFGYGSYLKDYTRSQEAIFSYEMQFPALLMKIGIVGVGIWFAVIVCVIIFMIKSTTKARTQLFSWLYLIASFGICIQTNPLLLSFTGISVVLFILLIYSDKNTNSRNSSKFKLCRLKNSNLF